MRVDRKHIVLGMIAGIILLLLTGSALVVFIVYDSRSEPFPSSHEPIPPEILDSALSIDDINLTPPDDILNEISYFSSGGGGIGDEQEVECPESAAPTINAFPQVEWLYPLYFYDGCGWVEGELVSVTIFTPDGEILTGHLTAYKGFTYSYEMTTSTPPGEYIIEFSGASGRVEKQIEVFAPDAPRVYRLLSEQKLVLYGFKPKEKARVFVFYRHPNSRKEIYTFVGWRQVLVGESGQVFIEIPGEELLVYFVEGKKSGVVGQEGSLFPTDFFFKDKFKLPFLPYN